MPILTKTSGPKLQIAGKMRGLREPWRYKIFYGGRGSGKSHGIATALVWMAGEKKMRILCAREVQKSIATSSKQLIQDKIIALGWGPEETGGNGFFTFTDRTIRGKNGSEFLFMGVKTNPDSVKSTEGIDICWLEEANVVSQRSLDMIIPTIRKPGSEIWASFNPHLESDPIYRMFGPGATIRDDALVIEMNWRDNPFFPDELRSELEWDKRRDADKYQHIWEGKCIMRSEAKVFTNWKEEDLDQLVDDTYAKPLLGADWGTRDPTVLVECFAWPEKRLLYFRNEAYKVGASIDEYPSLFAGSDWKDPPRWENPFAHPGIDTVVNNTIVADSSRPDTVMYMKDRGFNIVGARRGNNSVEEGVEFLKSYDIAIHPRCRHVRDEFSLYSYKVDPQTDQVLSELADKDNHTIDSSRYAVESLRRASARGPSRVTEPTVYIQDV